MTSIADRVVSKSSINPQTGLSSNTSGKGVDTQGFNSALIVGHVGGTRDTADGDETYKLVVEESTDDGSSDSYEKVTAAAGEGGPTVTLSSASATFEIELNNLNVSHERWLRTKLVTGGTTPSIDISSEIVLGEAFQEPV